MSFVRLAMGRRASAFCSNSTRPESRSASAAAATPTRGGSAAGSGVTRAVGYGDGEPSGGTGVGGGTFGDRCATAAGGRLVVATARNRIRTRRTFS